MTPSEKEQQLAGQLSTLPDAFERLNYLVDRARHLPPPAPDACTDTYKIPGCLADLWIVPERSGSSWHFHSRSDAPVVGAVAGLLCEIYSGASSSEILRFEPTILRKLGIIDSLTPHRREGVHRMTTRIRDYVTMQQKTTP